MDWVVCIALAAGLLWLGFRALVAYQTPWPRKARLSQKFGGLFLFGLDGSYLSLENNESGRGIKFEKNGTSPESGELTLRFLGEAPTAEKLAWLLERLSLLGVRPSGTDEEDGGHCREINLGACANLHPATCERIAELALETLGHSFEERYRIEFEGPTDYSRVNEYYGFGKGRQ